jgi:hypothetical protein
LVHVQRRSFITLDVTECVRSDGYFRAKRTRPSRAPRRRNKHIAQLPVVSAAGDEFADSRLVPEEIVTIIAIRTLAIAIAQGTRLAGAGVVEWVMREAEEIKSGFISALSIAAGYDRFIL